MECCVGHILSHDTLHAVMTWNFSRRPVVAQCIFTSTSLEIQREAFLPMFVTLSAKDLLRYALRKPNA